MKHTSLNNWMCDDIVKEDKRASSGFSVAERVTVEISLKLIVAWNDAGQSWSDTTSGNVCHDE